MLVDRTLLIDKPGTFLGKKSRRVVVKTPDSKQEFSLLKLKEINLVGSGISLSNDLIITAAKQEVQINFLDNVGRVSASLVSPFLNQTVETARAQIKAEGGVGAVSLAKEIILTKIRHQHELLVYFQKHQKLYYPEKAARLEQIIQTIILLREQLRQVKLNHDSYQNKLFSFEGRASGGYWQGIKILLQDKGDFHGRTGRGAKDLVNSLLNYGYGILYTRVLKEVLAAGLLPFAGFLHSDRSGKSSLVLDVMEIFRQPIVD